LTELQLQYVAVRHMIYNRCWLFNDIFNEFFFLIPLAEIP